MNKSSAAACLISFQNSQGQETCATVVRLSRHSVAFEIYSPSFPLQISEVLDQVKIMAGDRPLYAGRAVVHQVVRTGSTGLCEAGLDDSWLDVEFLSPGSLAESLPAQFDRFVRDWQTEYKIASEYKLVIADMQSFFIELRNWLEQVELGIRSAPGGDRLQLEREVLDSLAPSVLPCIDALFDRFEAVAGNLPRTEEPAHRTYMRRQLHPLILCSPFAYRTYQKPLGYAGDFEMVNMMTRPPYEGGTLYAKMLNVWFLRQTPAQAHRNRIDLLKTVIRDEAVRVWRVHRRPARILNLGCGPATEAQIFLSEDNGIPAPQITLLDFNEETLQHTRDVFHQLGARLGKTLPIEFQKRSVHSILKEAARSIELAPEKQFDLIYCAGLFDYLPDFVCQKLMTVLYSWLAPEAALVGTNVDPSNPIKKGMEHLLDWHLLYRTSHEARTLKPAGAPDDTVSIVSDKTGVNLFMTVRKPRHE